MEKGSISSDGSLVLPDSIREKLAISENTDVIFIETERGVEIVTKKANASVASRLHEGKGIS